MASETVDPIDWAHPPPSLAVPTERQVHSTNRFSLSSTGNLSGNFSMKGNHLAYVATQGGLFWLPPSAIRGHRDIFVTPFHTSNT